MRGNMIGGGGGVVDIDGLTAIAEKVVSGYLFIGAGSEDEQAGSMPDIGAVDEAQNLMYNRQAGLIRVGMNPGAHITNGTMGMPEVTVPQASLASLIGLVASAIAYGTTIAGVAGSYGGDGTINAAGVLAGLVGYGKGQRVVGEMPNRGAVNPTIAAGEKYDIPAGYHNGSGKVTAKSLASQTVGDATAAQILAGMIAWVNGARVTGTMPNIGKVTPGDLDAGESYTIPAGYHNGQGTVKAKPLSGQSSGTAAKEDILNTKTAWVNGVKLTGTMPNQGKVTPAALTAGGSYTIPAGYHNGQGVVSAKDLASQTGGTAGAGDILSGKTAWVDGQQKTGTMPNQGKVTPSALAAGGSYTIPAGYHNGQGVVSAKDLASQTGGTAGAGDILSGKTAWVNGEKKTGTIGFQESRVFYPNTSDQTIASGKYLSGPLIIKGVTTQNIDAANIKKDIVVKVGDADNAGRIKNVTGTYEETVVVLKWYAYQTNHGSSHADAGVSHSIPESARNIKITFTGIVLGSGSVTGRVSNYGDFTVASSEYQCNMNQSIYNIPAGSNFVSISGNVSGYYGESVCAFITATIKYST